VTVGDFVAKPLDLRPVGDIDDVRRDAQPLRQSRRLAQPLRFRQAGRRDVRQAIEAIGLFPLNTADLLRIVELWDPL
jgi:hypothetical protein